MSLCIVLSVNGEAPIYNPDTSISFEEDNLGDYWYMYTMIKQIAQETGELIDLCDNAEFSGAQLKKMETIVAFHLDLLSQTKLEQWEVHVGRQIHPVRKELYKTVVKSDLQEKLERLLMITQLARKTNEKVISLGD